ncbi:MAG: ATP-binding protein, partial [Sulfurovaceae bacterium]|nr:ATP-binding protein [Sulfurovaceae bacterium]
MMVIKSLILKNFRAYKNIVVDFDSNMNVIVGQNDIGKSTILEALDIFFGQKVIKIDVDDLNNNVKEKEISIEVKFELTKEDAKKLKLEYFLNMDNDLEIHKKFKIKNTTKKLKEEFFCQISTKDLEAKKAPKIMKEIYEDKVLNNNHKIKLDSYNKNKIFKTLPIYYLFQSDKVNKDTDKDIQKILKQTTKKLEEKFQIKIEELKKELEEKLEGIGKNTLEKMEEIGLDTPNSIIPKVIPKNLDSFFSFNLESEDIPLNKRGSGFRRMITLNYLRAEIENDNENKNIIYAIEEPETAQHPNNQKKLMESLIELSKKENYQIIITTHIPEIAKMANENNLILIKKDKKFLAKLKKIKFYHSQKQLILKDFNYKWIELYKKSKNSDENLIIENTENKLNSIIETLGILPNINIKNIQKVKVVVCLEGYTDIEFLKNINKNIEEFNKIVDLEDDSILTVFLGGSALQHYINYNYLDKLDIPQVHIYDSDYNQRDTNIHYQYKKYIDKINEKENNNYG